MPTVPQLMSTSLHDVFGNRDGASRRAAIEATFTEDVVFTDPEGTVRGHDALEGKAAGLLGEAPDSFVFAEDGRTYASDEHGALGWAFGPEGAPVLHGIDVVTVRDGRIATLTTFFAEGETP
jgi:ketosteroid isomerase-like protein